MLYRVCIWTGLLLLFLAVFNACTIITKFTRIAGELFGMLIAVLFMQEAFKVSRLIFTGKEIVDFVNVDSKFDNSQGVISEFSVPKSEDRALEKYQFQWLYTNGLLAIIFSSGLLFTARKSRRARSWLYGTGR